MRVIIEKDAGQVAEVAEALLRRQLSQKPKAVLGLATGATPLQLYQRLVEANKGGLLSFAGVTSFNLDEYVGLEPGHVQSYRYFMDQNLFNHVDIDRSRTHLPDVFAEDLDAAGQIYDQQIQEAGGIDWQLLGIGGDGHIGFNEPGSSLASRTRLKALTRQTREDNSRFFDHLDQVPQMAVTMGIGSILQARTCVLLATGAGKAQAVRDMIEGPVCARVPASALQLHSHVIAILDEPAAAELEYQDYYRDSERLQRQVQPLSLSGQS